MRSYSLCILALFLGVGATAGVTPAEASKTWSNRVLVAKLPRRMANPEYCTIVDVWGADIPPGTVIKNSSFGCEVPETLVFPKDMTGVTFIGCNLDNCILPEGNKSLNNHGKPVPQKRWMNRELKDAKGDAVQVPWLVKEGSTDFDTLSLDGKTLEEKTAEVTK